ncbi:MAG TPA: hypothetical protein VK864_21010, partial [Longimicrobiales bacterium]|nr:hypothetical protein [Longimicrobiales bacterium]
MPALRGLLIALMLMPVLSSADPWLAPGDVGLRHDLEMLADAGVVKGPVTQWPVPWPDVARDVLGFEALATLTPGEQRALERVRRAARAAMRTDGIGSHLRLAGSTEPDVL